MLTIINSLFPVFAVILFGYTAKHYKFLSPEFWPSCERLAYYVLLPLLLFISISTSSYDNLDKLLNMVYGGVLSVSAIVILVFLAKPIFKIKNFDFTPIMTGSICPNAAFIGIPIAFALFGKDGVGIYALLLAVLSIFSNAITIIILSYYAHEQGNILVSVFKKVILHPQLIACTSALIVNYCGIILPKPIFSTMEILGKSAVPIGLLIVGGALDIKAIKGSWHYVYGANLIKLIITPLIAIYCIKLLNISGLQANILAMYSCLPTGAATFLLVKKMKGNSNVMAGIIVFGTICAFITMAIVLNIAQRIFPY